MAISRRPEKDAPAHVVLEKLVTQALGLVKRAKKNRQNLSGNNYYGNKLAGLKADATNAFQTLASQSVGDTTGLAEIIQLVFSAETASDVRLNYSRELIHRLKTTWYNAEPGGTSTSPGYFPNTILERAKNTSIAIIGRQMNGCFAHGWYDACAVMMRRLLETSIIEAYEAKGIADRITDKSGNYFQLSQLIDLAMNELKLSLSRNAKQALPGLKNVGHLSAHSRYFHATKSDVDRIQHGCRVVLEEFLRHADLI